MPRHSRASLQCATLWVMALGLAAVLAPGCDYSLDAPPPAESGSDASDWTPGTTSPDVRPSDAQQPFPPRNACGGEALGLSFDGHIARPGDACGAAGDGVLICSSRDTLRCAKSPRSLNACGGSRPLTVEPGSACGPCAGLDNARTGVWVCDDRSPLGLRCAGATAPNVCGGCADLQHRPGSPCEQSGTVGRYVCVDPDTLVCDSDAANACGGAAPLVWLGEPALPGDLCLGPDLCGDGVLRCDGPNVLTCAPSGFEPPPNACGGCEPLEATPGSPCGPCGDGTWACDGPNATRCTGATAPTACGACNEPDRPIGAACGDDDARIWICDGDLAVCAAEVPAEERNACGGTADLPHAPGTACAGDGCDGGTWTCEGLNRVSCAAPPARPLDHCGCDGPDRTGTPCGVCAKGTWLCEDGRHTCIEDALDDGRNACGSCGDLPGTPDTSCGTCLTWRCPPPGGPSGLRCVPNPNLPGCGDLATCESLGCDSRGRFCSESDGEQPARCTGCKPGYTETDGRCIAGTEPPPPSSGSARVCDPGDTRCTGDLAEACAADGTAFERVQDCAADGHACVEGACICLPGRQSCDGQCVDTRTSTAHCGGCGNACALGESCINGNCRCPAGLDRCGGECVDVLSSQDHCGSCNTPCRSDELCQNGGCVCTGTAQRCGNRCVDFQSSPGHCGRCDNPCMPPLFACVDGNCACPVGQTLCGDVCVDTRTSTAHCGSCNSNCRGECVDGNCVLGCDCPTSTVYCRPGQGLCPSSSNGCCGLAGQCVLLETDDNGSPICP